MKRFLLVRLGNAIIVFICAATVVFFLDRVTGNPAAILLPPDASLADEHQLAQSLGLNAPLIEQYWRYMDGVLLHLDLGQSLYYRSSVLSLILERFPATIELASGALVVALVVSIPAGVIAAVRRGPVDTIIMSLVLLGQCSPAFFTGILLILLFSIVIPVFPATGIGGLSHLVLPSVTLGMYSLAVIARLLRSSLIEVFGEDYLRTARAKGLSTLSTIVGHALRNAALPVTTVIGLEVGSLLGGAVLTETVFAWPGLGQLTVQAIDNRDFPLVQGIVLLFVTTFLVLNIIVDLLYAVIDPRVRYS